jgi:hypothetical protein
MSCKFSRNVPFRLISSTVQSEIEGLQRSLAELEAQSQRMDTYINQLNADLQEQQVWSASEMTFSRG